MSAEADIDVSGMPFEQGFTLELEIGSETPLIRGLAGLVESLGELSTHGSARLIALQEPGEFASDLRRLDLLEFWDAPENRGQMLLLLRFEFRADARATAGIHPALSRLRLRADASTVLEISMSFDRLQSRRSALARLASMVRLPHQVDRPLGRGDVYRLEADASLLVSLTAGERLGVSIRHSGPGDAILERGVSIRGGLRTNASADARLRWDVRAARAPHSLALEIHHANAAEIELALTADAVATLGTRGVPDRASEIIEALLEGSTDDPAAVADEIIEAIPELVDEVDDALIRASRLRLKAGIEAALAKRSSDKSLVRAVVDLDRVNALSTIRRLGSGDLSPIFEESNAIVELDGSVREELLNRATLQFALSSPRGTLRRMKRSEIRSTVERKIRLDDEGVIHFTLGVTGSAESTRERWGETLETLFELALTGASDASGDSESLEVRSLRWNVVMTDGTASRDELTELLGFIEALGYRPSNSWSELGDIPRMADGTLGRLKLTLDLRIDPTSVAACLRRSGFEDQLRESMRRAILLGQLGKPRGHMQDVAWAYWSGDARTRWQELRRRSVDEFFGGDILRIDPVRPGPMLETRAPERIDLTRSHRILLDRLHSLEDRVVESLSELASLAGNGTTPHQVKRAMHAFLGAARGFDAADAAPETIYYVIESLFPIDERKPSHLIVSTTFDEERWRKRIPLQPAVIRS